MLVRCKLQYGICLTGKLFLVGVHREIAILWKEDVVLIFQNAVCVSVVFIKYWAKDLSHILCRLSRLLMFWSTYC